jgi:DNA-binding NarL/FixJ family response regulator
MRHPSESAVKGTRSRRVAADCGDFPGASRSAKPLIESLIDDSAWLQVRRRLGISARQAEILRFLFDGNAEKEIADRLSISERTVHAHMTRIHLRLAVHNRAQLLTRVLVALAAPSERTQ